MNGQGGLFMPSDKDNAELHEELLLLLKKFDGVCRRNDIKYSLHGGTLLGAVREKGFIPWDDDADISLTRENFSKLRNVFVNVKSTDELYFDEVSSTVVMIWLRRNGKIPVWIDIFIYDYISENFFLQKLKILGLVFFLGITKTDKRIKLTAKGEYKGVRFAVAYGLYTLGRLFSHETKLKWKNKFSANCLVGNKRYMVRSNDQYKGLKLIISHNAVKDYFMVPFENTELMVHAGYAEILRSSYGDDYMTPVRMNEYEVSAHKVIRES